MGEVVLHGARYLTKEVTGAHAHPYQHLVAKRITTELPYLDYAETLEWYQDIKHGTLPSGIYDANGNEVPWGFDHWCQALMDCNDRYFLLTHVLNRGDLLHPWLFDRCREVEYDPDGYIDLWARFHGKSSIITTGGIIQEILRDPEITIAIFSVNKAIATEFLGQIKEEFETNEALKLAHRDVCFENPRSRNALDGRPAKWGLARGITVKRLGRPKEATVEAHGLIDGQPTGRHFHLHVYDDVVTQDYLSELQLKKTTQRFELADNLGTRHGVRKWIAGTRYHFADTYGVIIERQIAKPRIYPATIDGSLHGTRIDRKTGQTVSNLVLMTPEHWEQVKRNQGRKTVNAQMLLNPVHGNEASFSPDFLRPYEIIPRLMNVYILVDPSKGMGERSDRTAIAVIGIDPGGVKYLLDGVCHRMKLTERYEHLLRLYNKWTAHPGVQYVAVGYERYGMQVDIEVIEDLLMGNDALFTIEELNTPRQGGHSKPDRIERLEPDLRGSRFLLPAIVYHGEANPTRVGTDPQVGPWAGLCYWLVWTEEDTKNQERMGKKVTYRPGQIIYRPARGLTALQREYQAQAHYRIVQPLKRWDENKQPYDLTRVFMEEAILHPFAPHDDMIDVCSRIYDINPHSAQKIDAKAVEGTGEDDGDFFDTDEAFDDA